VALLNQAVTEIGALVPENMGQGTRGTGYGIDNSEFRIPNSAAQSANSGAQGAKAAAPSAKPAARVVKHWKAKDFKREFNKIVKADARFAGKELK
jgi:hypothetical protein